MFILRIWSSAGRRGFPRCTKPMYEKGDSSILRFQHAQFEARRGKATSDVMFPLLDLQGLWFCSQFLMATSGIYPIFILILKDYGRSCELLPFSLFWYFWLIVGLASL